MSFTVPESDSLPFADFTVQIFAYNIKRGVNIRSGEVSITNKSLAICTLLIVYMHSCVVSVQWQFMYDTVCLLAASIVQIQIKCIKFLEAFDSFIYFGKGFKKNDFAV